MDPFKLFTTSDYTFLELEQTAAGNGIKSETPSTGILKYRDGMVQEVHSEAYSSQATLHMRPVEPYIATLGGHMKLIGHGVRADGDTYRIDGIRVGKDFDTGAIAFYLCTLKKESLWQSELPLE